MGRVRGTVDLVVLKALWWEPMHGFGISAWLEQHSAGAIVMNDSALYQVLHRLEERELVESEWGVTENNRQAKYYSLTAKGRKHLHSATETWLRSSSAVTRILTLNRAGTR